MPRDINRIDPFLEKIGECWKKIPDWRFGQLMVNVLGTMSKDPFFSEDDEMLKHFEKYFEKPRY